MELQKRVEKISIELNDFQSSWIDELYRIGNGMLRRSQIYNVCLGRDWYEAKKMIEDMVSRAN